MGFDRVNRDFPVLLFQLDQPLGESDGVLEGHVVIHHAMADQEWVSESLGVLDRRASSVGQRIVRRRVQNVPGVAVVVVSPVRDRPQCGAAGECPWASEEAHEGDETSIAAPVDTHSTRIDVVMFGEPGDAILKVVELGGSHVASDRRPPVAAVAGTRTIVEVEDHESFSGEQVVEETFAVVPTPARMCVLKIARAMYKEDGGSLRVFIESGVLDGRNVEAAADWSAMPTRYVDEDWWSTFDPIEPRGRRMSQDSVVAQFIKPKDVKFGGMFDRRMQVEEIGPVRRDCVGLDHAGLADNGLRPAGRRLDPFETPDARVISIGDEPE